MSSKTIHGAVIEVLKSRGGNATLDEIVSDITSNQMYVFKAKSPKPVIRQSIHRRCEGENRTDRSSKILFRRTSSNQYELI
jgi:hypothetical protein